MRRISVTLLRRRLALTVLATYLAYVITYTAINRVNGRRAAHVLFLPGEERIPLVPAFAVVYAAGFVLPLLVIWMTPDWRRFRRILLAFGIVVAVAFLMFLAFPVTFERSNVPPGAAGLLRLAYWDGPSNDFPSLHVAINWLVYFSCRREVRYRALLLVLVVGISLSTVLVKQHYLVDVPAGFLLGYASWWAAGRFSNGTPLSS